MANHEEYKLRLISVSQKDLDKLPIKIKLEILTRHFTKLKLNPRNYSERLRTPLKGYYSYHFGHHPEYRILFAIVMNEIVIIMIATRENFYKEAYRRLV